MATGPKQSPQGPAGAARAAMATARKQSAGAPPPAWPARVWGSRGAKALPPWQPLGKTVAETPWPRTRPSHPTPPSSRGQTKPVFNRLLEASRGPPARPSGPRDLPLGRGHGPPAAGSELTGKPIRARARACPLGGAPVAAAARGDRVLSLWARATAARSPRRFSCRERRQRRRGPRRPRAAQKGARRAQEPGAKPHPGRGQQPDGLPSWCSHE